MFDRSVSFAEVFLFVWGYWRRQPAKFALIVVGVVLSILFEVQVPARSAELVTAVLRIGEGSSAAAQAWTAAFWLLGILALVALVQQGYFRLWMYFASAAMQAMFMDGFRTLQRFSAQWHENAFAGATVRKVTRGMWAYDDFADVVVVQLGPTAILLVALSTAMFLRDPAMGLYFAVSVALFVGASVWMSLSWVAPANRLSNEADTTMGGTLADSITCNSVVKAFGAEDREDRLLHDVSSNWRHRARRAWTRSMDPVAVQSVLIIAMLGGLLAISLARAADGAAALADMVYVITAYFIVNGYLREIGWELRALQRAVNELDDLVEISKTAPQVADRPNAPEFQPDAGTIQFRNVGFSYGNQPEPTFDGLCLEIAAGEKVALVGESGSGKSTFLKLLQRLYDVDRGSIVVDGQDVASVAQESLRRCIAVVPQEPILFHRSLRENIAYGRPEASFDDVAAAAKKAHAHDFICNLTAEYDTLVGERGVKLSGGERQRVAIARAILADAPILILDEATSSLDSITEHLIQDAIANLLRGRTAIVVAHRLSTVRNVDRILVFDRGADRGRRQSRATDGAARGTLPSPLRHAVARLHRRRPRFAEARLKAEGVTGPMTVPEAQDLPRSLALASFLGKLADGVQQHIGIYESHVELPGVSELLRCRSRSATASARAAARSWSAALGRFSDILNPMPCASKSDSTSLRSRQRR